MENLRTHIIGIIVITLTGGILSGILSDGFAKNLVKLLCGLLLTVKILMPLTDVRLTDFSSLTEPFFMEGKEIAASGEKMAQKAIADIIKAETEAYIQNKAADYYAELTAEVILKDTIPISVVLKGNISPYGKMQLERMLEKDLNIPKENQQWI